jgi:hypothetical protein
MDTTPPLSVARADVSSKLDLVASGLLSDPPAGGFTVPGDEVERAALGYLHADCGHCHNQDRPGGGFARCYDPQNELDFLLRVDRLGSVWDTPTYQTVGHRIHPGDPDNSYLLQRVSRRDFLFGLGLSMPPLGTEEVDPDGVRILTDRIEAL